jgi:FkbH-like protein
MEVLKLTDIIKANKQHSEEYGDAKEYRVRVLSNITCNQLGEALKFNLFESSIPSKVEFGDYDNVVQDSRLCKGYDLVIIHYDLEPILEKSSKYIEDYDEKEFDSLLTSITGEISFAASNLKDIPLVIIDSFDVSVIGEEALTCSKSRTLADKLNEYLHNIKQENLHIVDLSPILTEIGIESAVDRRLYALSKTLYTLRFWMEYAFRIAPLICKVQGRLKKAVIFDCDNTLWKGVLGEDGEDGIDMAVSSKIGLCYNKVQQMAVWLSHQGVIIGLCSKNNPADVDHVIGTHNDMCLRDDNIVIKRINWQDKASNLRSIASGLNIGLDSLIFIDDSPFEINLIKEQVPEVFTFQVPSNIIEYPDAFRRMIDRYFLLNGSQADMSRTKQYKEQVLRDEEKDKFTDIESYLKSLDLQILIKEDDATSISRIAQLTQKTNQFNLTTKRYTEQQIKDFIDSSSNAVLSVSVADKFGDSGLTGVLIYSMTAETASIDTFLLSCRVMGRNIEKSIMDYFVHRLQSRGIKILLASYIPTKKNLPVAELYESLGFLVTRSYDGSKDYSLSLKEYKEQNVDYIKIN